MIEETITEQDIDLAQMPESAALTFGRKIVIGNFVALGFATFVEAVGGLVAGIYVRRILGVTLIGQISWAAAIVSYLALLVNPGLDVIVRREVSRKPEQARQYLVWSSAIQALLATLGFGLAVAFSVLVPRPELIKWLIVLQALALFLIPLDFRWLLFASEKVPPLAVATTVVNILQIVALVLLVREPSHVIRYVLISYPFKLGLYLFSLAYSLKEKVLCWGPVDLNRSWGKTLLTAALPIGLANFAILLYNNFDTIVLGLTTGDAAVGLYRSAYTLMLAPVPLLLIMHQISFPMMSRSVDYEDRARQLSEDYLRILSWAGLGMAAIGWATGRYLVVLLFGPKYQLAGPMFEWLSINLAFIFFNFAYNDPLMAWNQQSLAARSNYIGSVVNVVVNLILIPYIGVTGAIITTILAELVVMVGVTLARRRVYPIPWLKVILPGLVTCISAALITRMLASVVPWYIAMLAGGGLILAGFVTFESTKVRLFYQSIKVNIKQ